MNGSNIRDNKTFETKVANLIAATRHLEIAQILMLRRLTLADPETRRWASEKQLAVVFTVILTKAIERIGIDKLRDARINCFHALLPNGSKADRDEDLRVLSDIALQMLGPAPMSEAETAQAGFERLLSLGPALPPPRIPRPQSPIKEPPPLFAAQLGPDTGALPPAKVRAEVTAQSGGESAAGGDPGAPVDFNALFDTTICGYSKKILALFRASGEKPGVRAPFMLAPEFGAVYEEVLRRFVLPQMRSSRHIQSLAHNYNWAEVGGDKLIDIIQGSEVNNPVLHNWDTRWSSFRPPKPGAKAKKLAPQDNPWPLFNEDATRGNYVPPSEEHLELLQNIIRFEADVIAKAWRELSQLYEQEFSPNARQEQAREGAFRDGIMRWGSKLPEHMGELFAIKAYFDFPRIDGQWVRKFITNFGRTDPERRRNAPFLAEFLQGLPD